MIEKAEETVKLAYAASSEDFLKSKYRSFLNLEELLFDLCWAFELL